MPQVVSSLVRGLQAALALSLLLGPARAAESRFEVRIEAPDAIRELLLRHLDLARWQGHERMTGEEFRRLYRLAPGAIAELLSTQGYYEPSVETALDEEAGRLVARIKVAPGEPVRVASVRIEFTGALAAEDPDGARKIDRLRAGWPLAPGAVFRHEEWEEGKRGLLLNLALDRYPLASIASSQAAVHAGSRSAVLEVVVDSGPAARFGELQVEGLERYPRSIVANLNPIRPGEPYSHLALEEFQTRLLASGYFTSVTVDAPARPDGVAPVRVWVEEREPRRLAFGIGYSTDYGARVQAEYRLLDFLDRGLQLGSRFKIEQRSRSARVDLYFPTDELGYRDRLIADAGREDVQNTLTDKVVLTAGRARRQGDVETDVSVNYIAEKQRIAGVRTEKRHAVTGNWAITLRRTNHPLFPDEGYLLNLQLGGAPGIVVAETTFFRAYGKAVGYLKAGSRGVVTLRGELGSVWAGEVTGVPSDYLFRTGGDSTVRGYAYQSLGVERGDAIVGGRALVVMSAEYTHWVTPEWGAAVFYDAGNAAARFADIRLAHGFGLGARWRSPVGPLNLDIAYGERSGKVRLHFSVGLFF